MENTQPVVNTQPTTEQPLDGTQPEIVEIQPVAGSKTDSELLLKSLHEEREKRRILEEELKLAKESTVTVQATDEVYSDEGLALKKEISSLNEKIQLIEEEKSLEKLYSQYPLLREKADEFKQYRQAEHPRAKIESVAKLFLSENDLLESPRKGLEQPTGGTRTPFTSGMTADDVANLRKNNFREYQRLIKEGKLKIAS